MCYERMRVNENRGRVLNFVSYNIMSQVRRGVYGISKLLIYKIFKDCMGI